MPLALLLTGAGGQMGDTGGAGGPAAPSDIPHARAGLWQEVTSLDDWQMPRKTYCDVGRPILAAKSAGCTKYQIVQTGIHSWVLDSECPQHGAVLVVHKQVSGDPSTAFIADATMHIQGLKSVARHERYRYLGDCPARIMRDFSIQGIFWSKEPDDQNMYVLLGSGFIRVIRFGDPDVFILAWLAAHPAATVTPISRMFTTNTRSLETAEIVYIWVEDGDQSLNVDMVRAGLFPGAAMYDMVDNLNGLNRWLADPKHADERAEIDKERAAAPQDRTERLVAAGDYRARIGRIQCRRGGRHARRNGASGPTP